MLPCKCVWVLLPFRSPEQLCASHFLVARAALGRTGKLKLWIVFLLGRKQEGAADLGLGGDQSPTQREGGSWASFCQSLNYLCVPEDIPKQDMGFFHCHGIFPVSPQQSTHWPMVTLCPWCHLSGVKNIPGAGRAFCVLLFTDTVRSTSAFPSSPGIPLLCIQGISPCSSPPAVIPHSRLFQTPLTQVWMEVSLGSKFQDCGDTHRGLS